MFKWRRPSQRRRLLGKFSLASLRRSGMIFVSLIAIMVWQLSDWPAMLNLLPKAHAASITIVLTSGTTWSVPPAWDSGDNTIEAIGAGGNGGNSVASTSGGAGGGGGEYRKVTNAFLTPGSTIDINISAGGAGSSADGTWLKSNGGSKIIEAKNGGNAVNATAGAGGSGGIGSTANYNGGTGGSGAVSNPASGAGGGGSAGPSGIGKSGADGVGGKNTGGGGGGGSNGGSSSAGVLSSSTTGGDGGNGNSGVGGGSGGIKNTDNAGFGVNGAGGGGGGSSSGSGVVPGGIGAPEDLWATGQGPSGGGGGGGGAGGNSASGDKSGGAGGTFGGGGGGAGLSGSHTFNGGVGGQGIIVIRYTSSVPTSISQSSYRMFNNPTTLGKTPWQGCQTEGGETTIPSGSSSSTVTLTKPITDINQTFLLVNSSGDNSVSSGNAHMVSGMITNTTTLTFERGASASGDAQVSYSVVKCYLNEFSVQRGQTTIASGSVSNTATINSVDTSKSMVIVSSFDDETSSNQQTGLVTGELQNSTTVLMKRNDGATVNDTINWQVVTFSSGSGATVQTGETNLGSGSSGQTASISSVNTASSWLYCSYDADTNGLGQTAVGCDLTDSTTITLDRYKSGSYNNRVRWYVVTFPSADVSVQRGNAADGGGSSDGVRYDIDIPITPINSITKAFGYITNTTSGTGSAYPRNSWISQLTDTNNLRTSFWRGSSSGAGSHYWQVVEFLPPPPDVGTPITSQNTPTTLASANRAFRLRLLLGVSGATLPQDTAFKLQYASLSGSCSASSYSDVTTSTPVAFHNIPGGLTDGTPLIANANDPTDGGNTVETQTYNENNNFSNTQGNITVGHDGEWDFSLADNSAPANSTYCFRVVKSSGVLLDNYNSYPQVTTSDGAFNVDIVNSGGSSVASPSVTMSNTSTSLTCTSSTGTLGTSSQKIRVTNHSAGYPWSLSIAATDGNTAKWSSVSNVFDYNDPTGSPPGCSAGADSDTYAGLLSFGFSGASITPQTGCSLSGVSLGSSNYFNEGITDSINLGAASSSADNGCYWDLTGIGLQQQIPAYQQNGSYKLDLTITLVAN